MKLTKSVCSLLLVLSLVFGLCLPLQGEEGSFGAAETFQSGEYILAVAGITPTGMEQGVYCITQDEAVNPGLLFSRFYEDNPGDAPYWKVTKVSDGQCTIQNPAKGQNGYLNISANTLQYGKKQNLNYEWVSGRCKFYATVGGTNYYIRFTNSTNNESRFHAGTGDGSNLFYLYGMVTPEPEPDLPTSPDADLPLPKEDPLLSIACISDPHADYGLQTKDPYIRKSALTTLRTISLEEDADLLLVGGDITSDNAKQSERGGWTYSTYQNVVNAYRKAANEATSSGRSLWACGNHDHEAGEDDGYDSYAGFQDIMQESCGTPLSVYRQKDDFTVKDQRYPDHILGLHYNIEGFDFLVLNPPYSQALNYSTGALQWLNKRLNAIGRTKTVFIVSHYPLTDSRGISTPTYGLTGASYLSLTGILKKYPNAIYLYGHNHGGAESVYISDDTFERITSYTADGRVVNNRNAIPTSFITSFMGSVSYYSYSLDPNALTESDPAIVQGLMIYVYKDRIVFQMKNYGTHKDHADRVLKSWTVMRDIEGALNGTLKDSMENVPQLPAAMTEILVTDGVNGAVVYDPLQSIRTVGLATTGVTVKSYGHTALVGDCLTESMKLSLKKLTRGDSYDALSAAVKKAVKEFAAYEMTVKDGKETLSVEGPVQVTLAVPEIFNDRAEEIIFAAYYEENSTLHMTDAFLSEDGKTVTFRLPNLTPFAVSARATVAQDVIDGDLPSGIIVSDVILAGIGGLMLIAGILCLTLVLYRMWKKDRATPYKE